MMAADYRHIGGRENRLGRHYSRFSPFSPAPALADQSLALRKSWNAGSNRRSQARARGHRSQPFGEKISPAGNKKTGLLAAAALQIFSPPRSSAALRPLARSR